MERQRKIIHIDMDAFFAAVEQRDNPSLRGMPIAVGHASGRSVVATASYEARKYGIRSAMPASKALKLCPQIKFVAPRFETYKAVSTQMHEIFHEYTDIIEPISLDEAFLDVTINKQNIPLAVTIAREIKAKIQDRLSLVASAGISYNKFLAKIASDYRKPNGLCTIHPSIALQFIEKLNIEQFWGIGPVTAKHMHELGIHNGADLRKTPLPDLCREFGKMGAVYYQFARGIDLRPVMPKYQRKSIGCERTLDTDLKTREEILATIAELSTDLEERLSRHDFNGTTLTLKMRYADFSQHTKSQSFPEPIQWSSLNLKKHAMTLFDSINLKGASIRLLGLTVSNPPHKETISAFNDWALSDVYPRQLLLDFDRDY